jgi:HTH-type transcriptional regulator/antitoxin HigA
VKLIIIFVDYLNQKPHMQDKIIHPGITLDKMLNERSLSQRDLASRIDVAHSLLNNILKGSRQINVHIAIALESAGFRKANYWLTKQMKYNLYYAEKDEEVIKKKKAIKIWNEMESLLPLSFFKKQNLGINSSDDIDKIYEIYRVKDFSGLERRISDFNPTYFRKSSKFSENKNNVIAWSLLAEHKAKHQKVKTFSRSNEDLLLKELNKCFYRSKNVIEDSEKILNEYGIKFLILNRPSQTPVDGKSFMCGENPAVVLSLKYKRLDNFAFTLLHEVGHVFEHLTNPEKPQYKEEDFFVNSSNTDIVEFEADSYASNKLIDSKLFNDFLVLNEDYSDESILEFSRNNKIHPGIVRGRICFEFPIYYRKRTAITALNKLEV